MGGEGGSHLVDDEVCREAEGGEDVKDGNASRVQHGHSQHLVNQATGAKMGTFMFSGREKGTDRASGAGGHLHSLDFARTIFAIMTSSARFAQGLQCGYFCLLCFCLFFPPGLIYLWNVLLVEKGSTRRRRAKASVKGAKLGLGSISRSDIVLRNCQREIPWSTPPSPPPPTMTRAKNMKTRNEKL